MKYMNHYKSSASTTMFYGWETSMQIHTDLSPLQMIENLLSSAKKVTLWSARPSPNAPRIIISMVSENHLSIFSSTPTSKMTIDAQNLLNKSTPDAVIVHINVSLPSQHCKTSTKANTPKACPPKPKWKRCDVEKYQELTEEKLNILLESTNDNTTPDVIINRINDILL